ncbi:MAG: DNA polymerase III subunit delta [Chloroflexi bacterium]|nr:DNA polymerase III subunit delta [Chloroflexota bacterium]
MVRPIDSGGALLYILHGEDDFSLTQYLGEIKRGLGDSSMLATNTSTFDGQKLTPGELKGVSDTVPFLAEKRLVVIEGLLGRFEARGSPRQKKTANRGGGEDARSFAEAMSNIPESTVIVLTDGKIKNTNSLFKLLSSQAEVRSFPLLREVKLQQWIEKEISEQGAAISPQAADLLARLVGGNLWIMSGEIAKLSLFTGGRRIEAEDINKVVSSAQEANVFAMVDAILDFKAGVAERLLEQLLDRGASPAYLLTMLSRQVRLVVQAKELRRQRKSDIEIQSKLGLAPFPLRKTLEQAQRYPLERLKQLYNKLLQTDLYIKRGKFEGGLALNLLVAELCAQQR